MASIYDTFYKNPRHLIFLNICLRFIAADNRKSNGCCFNFSISIERCQRSISFFVIYIIFPPINICFPYWYNFSLPEQRASGASCVCSCGSLQEGTLLVLIVSIKWKHLRPPRAQLTAAQQSSGKTDHFLLNQKYVCFVKT